MRRWLARAGTGLWITLATLAAIVGAGWMPAGDAIAGVYPSPVPVTEQVAAVVAAAPRPAHDAGKPTAVVVVGNEGANAADTLAPYEALAASGAFNVYTAAPERRPVPLNGGLDLVPDYSFAELAQRTPAGVDVVVVPALPDAKEPTSEPVRHWLRQQLDAGTILVGVCVGTDLLANEGLLDGKAATSHWFGLMGLTRDYPTVNWTRGTRYVDIGQIITTAGVLSGVDGALRAVERLAGEAAAHQAANAIGWRYYHPGVPGPTAGSKLGAADVVAPINLAYRTPTELGVLLTDGVGEIELASIVRPYTELSYLARPRPLSLDGQPIRSAHGLTFVPRESLADAASELDRLVVPGHAAAEAASQAAARAAADAGLKAEYVHTSGGFAFDDALRDVAAHTDVATATWVAKTLEYPAPADLDGPAWPWAATLRVLLVGLAGALVAVAISWLLRRRPSVRHFVVHYVEMVVSMFAGMALLDPLWTAVWPALPEHAAAYAMVMAFDMTIGMGLWMWFRGHSGRMIGEMSAAMVAPFVVLLIPTVLGLVTGDELMMIGHTAMLFTMLAAMLGRGDHYTRPHRWTPPWRRRRRTAPADEPTSRHVERVAVSSR